VKLKRLIVVVTLFTFLGVGVCTPKPVHADTADNFLYAGIALAVYIGVVFGATKLIYGQAEDGLPPVGIANDLPSDDQRSGVRVAPRCGSQGGNLTLVCW
jgi:hypothetical protein